MAWRKGLWIGAALAAFVVSFPGTRGVPFSNTAEPQEALVVREMKESGEWVLPRVNGELIPSKPPLFHWLALAVSTLCGDVDEFSTRLPSMIAASLTVGLVFAVGAAEWGVLAATIAAVTLATSPEWMKWAVTVRTDALFALLLTASFLLGERWLRSGRLPILLALAAVTGTASLAKGFAGAGLVAMVLLIETVRRRLWQRLRPGPLVPAAAVFLAVAGSWYAAALAEGGGAFFQKQVLAENVYRFLPSEGGPSRDHSFLFYFPTLLVGMMPWSLALPHAIVVAWREWRARSPGLPPYLLSWLAVVFLVCTAASGKRSNYLLPLYPAAALLVGRELAELLNRASSGSGERPLRIAGAMASALAVVVAVLLGAWRIGLEPWNLVLPLLHPQDRVMVPAVTAKIGAPSLVAVLVSVALAAGFAAVTLGRRWRALYALGGFAMMLIAWTVSFVVSPLESELKSFAPFTERVARRMAPGEPITFLRQADFAVLFYLRRHVPVEQGDFAAIPRPGWALVWEKDWQGLSADGRSNAEVVEVSPRASASHADTHLFLVRLGSASGERR
jgi:4-amino-4-deoxy-L-arabinose transferase-like glycosyltransferase